MLLLNFFANFPGTHPYSFTKFFNRILYMFSRYIGIWINWLINKYDIDIKTSLHYMSRHYLFSEHLLLAHKIAKCDQI